MLAAAGIGTLAIYTAILKKSLENGELGFTDVAEGFEAYSCRFRKTGKREDIFLATKFGSTFDPQRPANGDPDYAKACLNKSLSRLGGMLFISFHFV